MRGARRRAPLETSRVGRLQGIDPQRVGGYEELGRSLGRRDHRGTLPEGVRELSVMGSPRYRRDGVRGTRDGAGAARRDRRGRARHGRIPRVALALTLTILALGRDRRRDHAAEAAIVPPKPEESFTAI